MGEEMSETIFIINLRHAFNDFKHVTTEPHMPLFDMDELMREIILVSQAAESPLALWNGIKDVTKFGSKIPKHERMDIEEDDDRAIERFYAACLKLTAAIKNKIREHHAYVDGKFPYEFGKFIAHDTFYLRRKPDVSAPVARHPEYQSRHQQTYCQASSAYRPQRGR